MRQETGDCTWGRAWCGLGNGCGRAWSQAVIGASGNARLYAGSGVVRGMLVFAINEKNETVGDGALDVPPENAQHFSVSPGKLPIRGRGDHLPHIFSKIGCVIPFKML